MHQFIIQNQNITIEGKTYYSSDFQSDVLPDFICRSEFHSDLYIFLRDWFSDRPTLEVQTSGSTGNPKPMLVEKRRMMQSARLTCEYLDLKPRDTALLCMSLKYIGGKMFVVRAIMAGLNLYPVLPSGNPLKDFDIEFNFAAMIPLQVFNSLQNIKEATSLRNIKNLIIGGGAIDDNLEKQLSDFPYRVYSTYGMTETLSHIALRQINGHNASKNYKAFDSISLSLSEDHALIIDAPLVSETRLYTNDIVHINNDGSFYIIGRKDNIINSGGIKIQIEEIESRLKDVIYGAFAISSLPDPKFGEIVVLAVEKEININSFIDVLPTYHFPKRIILLDKIPLTETGKINRRELKRLLLQHL